MATNNVTNEGTKTAHGIYVAQGTNTPNYLTLTNGQLLIGNTGNDPSQATLTAGTNVTITNGAGTITVAQAAGGSGALTLIASATASASATVDLANNLSSTYDNYLVLVENFVAATATANLELEVGTGSTPTWQTSSYVGAFAVINGTSTQTVSSSGTTFIQMNSNLSSTSTRAGHMIINVNNVNDAANDKTIYFQTNMFANNTVNNMTWGAARWESGTVVTSLRFLMSSGNITSGTFKLYGYSN